MWVIVALIVGGLVGALVLWLRAKDIKVSWYEWLIGVIGLLLLLFTIQNYFAVQAEWESDAANMFILVTGLPAVILMVVAGLLSWRRQRAAA